ncbi:unnamed protein product [Trichobilharzia szidati]|nr:unnamed protein product [Trichobilharzia szidati]
MEDKNKVCTSNTPSSSSSSEKKKRHKHRNNHSKVVTSTPVNEGPYRPNISSVTRESSTFLSINERLSGILAKISSLEDKWSTNFRQSCIVFTNLATHIWKILTDSLSTDNIDDCITYTLCDLYLSDNKETMKKLRTGLILETDYDKLAEHVKNMEDCCTQLKLLTSQFDALSKLDQNESLHRYSTTGCYSRNNNSSFSTRKCSTPGGGDDDISSCMQSQQSNQLFSWKSFSMELIGLVNQIERDLTIRRHLIKIILPRALHTRDSRRRRSGGGGGGDPGENDDLLKLISIWRHFGQYVQWSSVLSMSEHILKILSSETS